MRHRNQWIVVGLMIVILGVSACAEAEVEADTAANDEPATVEHVEGSEFSRVTFTAKAAERIGIETAEVQEAQGDGAQRLVIPYAAVLYGPNGETWTYTNPEPLVFVRHLISVDSIEGDLAMLTEGPPPGTTVVTVGAAELIGTEFGVGH